MTENSPLLGGPAPLYPTITPSNDPNSSPPPPYSSESAQATSPKQNALPPANQFPQIDINFGWAVWQDRGFAIAFWIHFLVVTILAFSLGIPALRADAKRPFDDPSRTTFDYNADLFIRVFVGGAALSALRVVAQVNESNARRDGNIVVLLLSCVAVCILRVFEGLVRYLNEWAFVYAALTGQSFRAASQSFLNLFQQRGWTMIINDDLAGHALTIVTVAIGLISASLGGIGVYAAMPNSPSRASIAGMAAFFCFIIGTTMGTVMSSILSSGVRTAFVCFAMNPAALGTTHPEHLQNLLLAWYKFHPQEFAQSGFAMHLPKPAASSSDIYRNV
ncbi:hypothetical protein I4U23_009143 [Adineta vaga]|nr:hypothetical protein I4U23_009143 [Adineta vaga]